MDTRSTCPGKSRCRYALRDSANIDVISSCYVDAFQNLLPIPIVSLANNVHGNESIYVIPDANEFWDGYLDGEFYNWYQQKGIDITRYAGAGMCRCYDLVISGAKSES